MTTVLFLCTGNTCRSPMAEGLFRSFLEERGREDIAVSSAGLAAHPGAPASENAVAVMAEQGIDLSHHRARLATKELLQKADRIVCMTESHRNALISLGVDSGKIIVMPGGVTDPFGGSVDRYRSCRNAIAAAFPELLKILDGRNTK